VSVPTPTRSFCGLRHGATDWNRQGRFQGRTDNPLNADGLAQAHDAASLLQKAGITRIVSSPLVRAEDGGDHRCGDDGARGCRSRHHRIRLRPL
jgi:bisphosphoglycerate-dependent phosphoglycerate mutase